MCKQQICLLHIKPWGSSSFVLFSTDWPRFLTSLDYSLNTRMYTLAYMRLWTTQVYSVPFNFTAWALKLLHCCWNANKHPWVTHRQLTAGSLITPPALSQPRGIRTITWWDSEAKGQDFSNVEVWRHQLTFGRKLGSAATPESQSDADTTCWERKSKVGAAPDLSVYFGFPLEY